MALHLHKEALEPLRFLRAVLLLNKEGYPLLLDFLIHLPLASLLQRTVRSTDRTSLPPLVLAFAALRLMLGTHKPISCSRRSKAGTPLNHPQAPWDLLPNPASNRHSLLAPHSTRQPPQYNHQPRVLEQRLPLAPSNASTPRKSPARSPAPMPSQSKDLLQTSGLPLGVVVCPLAKLDPNELSVPLVDFGGTGPLRCTRCKAYVNCFTRFIQGGRMFACNICTMQNDTPRDYYCAVDQLGTRRDVADRMELARGSVEFVVPAVYSVRESAQQEIVVFALDVSVFAFQSNLVASVVAALPSVLETLQKSSPHAQFGLMTFDTAVHYYRLDQETISMVVCPDVDDPAAPVPARAWLLPVHSPNALEKIQELQDLIMTLFSNDAKNQSVSGAAVTSAVDSLLTSGGRVSVFHAGPPRLGVGKITKEEAASSYGTTKEVQLYAGRGVHAHYEELARLSAQKLTGGYVLHLPQFDKDKPEHLQYTKQLLCHLLGKHKAMEAVLKVRVSSGLRVDSIYGNYMPSAANDDEVNMALVDQDTAVGVTFVYDGKLPQEHMYIQRSHTCMCSGNGQAVKEKLVDDCVHVLSNYRKHCATNSSSGQLILPESLKLLPLYTLATLKSRALRNNLTGQQARGLIDVRADERVMLLHLLNSFPVEHAVSAVYPKMYALHDLTEEVGTLDDKGDLILPAALPPTAEKLDENGLFLLHSSTYMYLFIGAKTNPTLLEDVFGVPHIDTSEQVLCTISRYLDVYVLIGSIVGEFGG
ncbi:hypothetical protein DYB30_005272 [Aphanomyces astaci]|uniref:Sec23/Sec24 trunk domain-containing protein n=2 Tax=Aphanomyces astaci TaxID=112090 RepID=A0A397CJU4_APHAT|nr:hypothetical protein DYB30_005272 [Aphanomyces astaci]